MLLLVRVTFLVVSSRALLIPELKQQFEIEPEDQVVAPGSKVILPCKVKNKRGVLQWTKDGFGLGDHRNLTGYDRYNMVGSDLNSDFDLQIDPVTLEDDGIYQCQVSPTSSTEYELRSRFAKLEVIVPPEPPKIVQGSYLMTYEYMETKLECTSYGGKPNVTVFWSDDQGNALIAQDNIVEELEDKRYYTKSILKFIAKPSNRHRTFSCRTQNSAQKTYDETKIKVEVKYPPHVDLVISSGATPDGIIPEGTDVRFECHVEANPFNVTYRWFIDGEIVLGNFTSEFILRNVTSDYHYAIVKCDVNNEYGNGQGTATLNVFWGPKFRNKPQSVEADLSDTVTLSCDVIGNPAPDISWLRGDPLQIVGHDANFSVRVTPKTVGQYFCRAHIQGYPDIEAEATIYLKDVPFIESPRIQFGIEHDTVQIECTALSIPEPDLVLWTFNGSEVKGPEYTILENPLPQGMRSTLIIRETEKRHFGTYTCNVTNACGSDALAISLQPPDLTEELEPWTIFNIAFTVVLVTIQIIVLSYVLYTFYCCKRPDEVDLEIIEKQTEEIIQSSIIPDSEATSYITHSNPTCQYFIEPAETQIEDPPTPGGSNASLKRFPHDYIVSTKNNRPTSIYDNSEPSCSRDQNHPSSLLLLNPSVPPMKVIPVSTQRYKPKSVTTKRFKNSYSGTCLKRGVLKRHKASDKKKRLSVIYE